MPNVKLSNVVSQSGILSVIFSLPGKGKTSSIRNFPKDKTAIVTGEPGGLQSLVKFGWEDAKVWVPTCPADYLRAVEEVCADKDIQHIVLDTASQYYEHLIKHYVENFKKDVSQLSIDMYRVANLRFQEMFRMLFGAMEIGKNVVCLVHMNYREHEEGDVKKIYKEPALPGQIPQWVCRQAALVIRAENVRMGQESKYLFVLDSGEGAYGKDLYGVVNGNKDNDLWALYEKIRLGRSPVMPSKDSKEAKEKEASQIVYKEMIAWGMENGINKKLIDEFISQKGLNIKTTAYDLMLACFHDLKEKFEKEGVKF